MEVAKSSKFPTTQWTAVLRSSRGDEAARIALASLCSQYWYPLFAFLRSRGHSPEDAEDLVQGFIESLLERSGFSAANEMRGKFRSFLLTAITRHTANDYRKKMTGKRGGQFEHFSLSLPEAEERFSREYGELAPEARFDRAWAIELLRGTLEKLQRDAERKGRGKEFALLKPYILDMPEKQGYAEIEAATGISEGALKVRVHRMKKHYRDRLREEIAHTLENASAEGVDSELRYLVTSLGGAEI